MEKSEAARSDVAVEAAKRELLANVVNVDVDVDRDVCIMRH